MPTTPSTLVVLIACETLGDTPDVPMLQDMVCNAGQKVRLLLLVSSAAGLALARDLVATAVDLDLEVLLSPDVAGDLPPVPFARLPPATKLTDQQDFALALSDVVLINPDRHDHPLAQRAVELGKPVVPPNNGLPDLQPFTSVAEALDPLALPQHGWRRHWVGRLEQTLVELLNLFIVQPTPFRTRCKRLWRCIWPKFDGSWCPASYFAPKACEALAADPRAFDSSSSMVARFEKLDRSAVFGAYVYRDLAWLVHFGAAAAVFAAVAGGIVLLGHGPKAGVAAWAAVELLLLAAVAMLMRCVRRRRLQERWTACRFGAEQLRIARMCLPVLVLQRALISRDTWRGRPEPTGDAPDLTRDALLEVKRAIRDHGLPRLHGTGSPEQAARWVACIVQDQIGYHENNHQRLERAERSLRIIANAIFFAAMAAVLFELLHLAWHCVPELPWLILLTAAGPAFAAAFHGAATRLAIVNRIALSQDMKRELQPILDALTEISRRPAVTDAAWPEIRQRTFEAAEAMGRENRTWHGLVRLQRDTLPV